MERITLNCDSNRTLSQTMSLDAIAAIKAKRLAKKRSAREQPEGVESIADKRKKRETREADEEHKAWVVREAKKRWRVEKPLSQMNGTTDMSCGLDLLAEVYNAKRRRLRRHLPREKVAIPLAGQRTAKKHKKKRKAKARGSKEAAKKADISVGDYSSEEMAEILRSSPSNDARAKKTVKSKDSDGRKPAQKPAGKTVVESPAKRHRKRERKSKSASKGQPKVVTPMTATPTPSNNPMTAPRVRACKLIEVPIVSPELETLPRYSRYAQEKFLMPVAIPGQTDLGINTLGSNLNKKSGTRESVVREGIRARYNSTIERPIRTVTRFSRRPIIVVPQAMSSLITLHNAKELLEQLHFVQPDMQRPLGTLRPEEVAIEREFSDGKLKKYRIIDNVSKLCPDEWQRVIAVFALGPHWQFKGWPWHGDAAVIFHKVCAFHLYYKDVGVHKDLLNMEINSLEISKNEPHTHSSILMQFWATLDKYVRTQGQFSFLVKERVYFPE